MVDGGVDGAPQVIGGAGAEGAGVFQGVRDGVEVVGEAGADLGGGVGQAVGEGGVGDRAEEGRAEGLADLAAEEYRGGGGAALGVADRGLDADDQRELEESEGRAQRQHDQGGLPGGARVGQQGEDEQDQPGRRRCR